MNSWIILLKGRFVFISGRLHGFSNVGTDVLGTGQTDGHNAPSAGLRQNLGAARRNHIIGHSLSEVSGGQRTGNFRCPY